MRSLHRKTSNFPPCRGRCGQLSVAVLVLGLLVFPAIARSQVDLAVYVTDQDTGKAIEQVKVEVVLFPATVVHMGFTDGTGRVEFLNVRKQQYLLRASKDAYQPFQERVDLSEQTISMIFPLRMRRSPDRPEPPGGAVSARVLAIPEAARNEFKAGLDLMGEKNDPKGSMGRFRKAIDIFPAYYEAYYMLGMAQLKTGDAGGGEASLRKAIEIQPKFFDPYYPLSELLIGKRLYDEAEKLLQIPLQEDPENWKWPYELGMGYGKTSQWDKGIAMGLVALGRKDVPTKIHLLLSDLYSNKGEIEKAISELETFKKKDPKSPMIPRVNEVLKQLRK